MSAIVRDPSHGGFLDSYDIVVAGGGPAGLSAAHVAAAQGLRVLIAEKHAEIGSPTRTSGGSFIADMVALGVPPHLYHPIRRCRLCGPSAEATFTTSEPTACIINVRGLYQYLAERAIAAGATLSPRTQVLGVDPDPGLHQVVTMRDHTGATRRVACALVIDATGFSSTLAVKAGIHRGYRRAGVGAEYDLYAPNFPEDMCVLAVGSVIAPAGYAWAFPYGNHRVRAGVGVIRPDVTVDPTAYLHTLLHNYAPLRDAFVGASPVEVHTGVIPGEGMNDAFVADGLMTAGDSAGQASSLAGEGIRFSMYAGRLAGHFGAVAVQRGDVSAAALASYEDAWRRRFGRNMRLAYIAANRLYASSDEEWDELIPLLREIGADSYARLMATEFSPGLALRAAAAAVRRPRSLPTLTRVLMRRVQRTTKVVSTSPTIPTRNGIDAVA